MKEFKIGDKVEIPKQKTEGQSYVEFLGEMSNYKLDYLLIDNDYGEWYSLKRDDGGPLQANGFLTEDLELYEEKYTIDYIKKNKIVVRITTAEQWKKVKEEGGSMAPWRSEGAIYNIKYGNWVEINSKYYQEDGYKVIDYSQIHFLEKMKEQFKGYEGRKLIGYKCPMDCFNGDVKRGTVYRLVSPTANTYKDDAAGVTQYTRHLPKEIVETWEPVYEEEFKVGDWVIGDNELLERDGYWKQKGAFQVSKISDKYLYSDTGQNNYPSRFRKATEEEIKVSLSVVVINGHKATKAGIGTIAFGCQTFNISELTTIRRLFHREINAKITIHGVEITNEIITKLLQL